MDQSIVDLFNVDDMDDEELAHLQPFLDDVWDDVARSEMTSSSSSSSSYACAEKSVEECIPMMKSMEEHILTQARPGASLKTMMVCFILTITAEPDHRMDKKRIISMCQRNQFRKRRVYDVANIMIVLGILQHVSKGVYQWIGRFGYQKVLREIQSRFAEKSTISPAWEADKQDVGTLAFITHITFSAMVSESVEVSPVTMIRDSMFLFFFEKKCAEGPRVDRICPHCSGHGCAH